MTAPPNPCIDADLAQIAKHAQRFARERVTPGLLQRDQTRALARALMREMGNLGLIAPELPESAGGQRPGRLAGGAICEVTAHANLSMGYVNLLALLNGQVTGRTRQARCDRAVDDQDGARPSAVRHRADGAARRFGRCQPAPEGRTRKQLLMP